MAGTQSFDVTTGCDLQEVDNAVNQAVKEITQRFDFKGIKVGVELRRAENMIVLTGPDDFKIKAIWEVLQTKLVRRKVPLRNLTPGKIDNAALGTARQEITLQQGIPIETAREIVKCVKDNKLKKVQVSIQADQVRVSSPSRDELQGVMALLRQHDFGIELNFGNFRSQ
jgi:uncharacterized protein YajQ (UPF0234 family)